MNDESAILADYRALIDSNKGLGSAHFASPVVFDLEKSHVFMRTWVCIGVASDISENGDVCPGTFLGMPLLLARHAGGVKVFHNLCSHRGAVLVNAPGKGRARITCPYHAWTYDLSGSLLHTPHVDGPGRHSCESLDPSRLGLREIRSAEWCGHVFTDFSGQAPPFDEWIRPMDERLGHLHSADLRRDPEAGVEFDLSVNWKIIAENFSESYHLPFVHRELNQVNPMEDHYQILGGHSYVGQGSTGFSGSKDNLGTLPLLSAVMQRSRYESFYVFPNLMLVPFPDMMFSIIAFPLSPRRTIERLSLFVGGEEAMAAPHAGARKASNDFAVRINQEDFVVLNAVQAGRESPAYGGGHIVSQQETTSLHFQKMVAARVLATANDATPHETVDLPTEDVAHFAVRGQSQSSN